MINILTASKKGGHGAKQNEDAALIAQHNKDDACSICVIADGQGGQRGGAAAAQLACASVIEIAQTYAPQRLLWQRPWQTILQKADQIVTQDEQAGKTTLTALCIYKNWIVGGSAGDNEAILYPYHTAPNTLTAKQAKNPPIGSGHANFTTFATKLGKNSVLLLMTDGVWKYVGKDVIHTAVRENKQEALVQVLAKHARPYGAGPFKDDFTLILAEHYD